MEVSEEEIQEINTRLQDNALKIQGLLDSLGQQAQAYENKVADLRVEVTKLTDANKTLQDANKGLQEQLNAPTQAAEESDPQAR